MKAKRNEFAQLATLVLSSSQLTQSYIDRHMNIYRSTMPRAPYSQEFLLSTDCITLSGYPPCILAFHCTVLLHIYLIISCIMPGYVGTWGNFSRVLFLQQHPFRSRTSHKYLEGLAQCTRYPGPGWGTKDFTIPLISVPQQLRYQLLLWTSCSVYQNHSPRQTWAGKHCLFFMGITVKKRHNTEAKPKRKTWNTTTKSFAKKGNGSPANASKAKRQLFNQQNDSVKTNPVCSCPLARAA